MTASMQCECACVCVCLAGVDAQVMCVNEQGRGSLQMHSYDTTDPGESCGD